MPNRAEFTFKIEFKKLGINEVLMIVLCLNKKGAPIKSLQVEVICRHDASSMMHESNVHGFFQHTINVKAGEEVQGEFRYKRGKRNKTSLWQYKPETESSETQTSSALVRVVPPELPSIRKRFLPVSKPITSREICVIKHPDPEPDPIDPAPNHPIIIIRIQLFLRIFFGRISEAIRSKTRNFLLRIFSCIGKMIRSWFQSKYPRVLLRCVLLFTIVTILAVLYEYGIIH